MNQIRIRYVEAIAQLVFWMNHRVSLVTRIWNSFHFMGVKLSMCIASQAPKLVGLFVETTNTEKMQLLSNSLNRLNGINKNFMGND